MAELLDRLLSRQRRRNPFSDVMGPDPLESAAAMDAAQGTDVSMPAPVSGRARMADPGEGMLVSGGGGGVPVRTANMRGAAPVQTTVQSGGSPVRATQTQCPGGRCPTPRRSVVTGGSNYQIIDDGGFPITSTVVGSPTVSSGAPVMTGGAVVTGSPSVPLGDTQSLANMAWEQQQMGQPAGRAFTERMMNQGRIDQIMAANEKNDAFSREVTREAMSQARIRLNEEAANAASERGLTDAMAAHAKESTASGSLEIRTSMKRKFLREGGNPVDLAKALARLDSAGPLKVDKDGKPIMPESPGAITQAAESAAMQEAFSTVALHGILGSAMVRRDVMSIGTGLDSRLVPRQDGESEEAYDQRKSETLRTIYGDTLPRAANTIISGLQRSESWENGDWLGVQADMEANIYHPLVAELQSLYAAQRQMPEGISDEEREILATKNSAEAEEKAQAFYDFFVAEAESAFRNPEYRKQDSWLNNAWQSMGQFWGGDPAPAQQAPADSNDTLPSHNPMGGPAMFLTK